MQPGEMYDLIYTTLHYTALPTHLASSDVSCGNDCDPKMIKKAWRCNGSGDELTQWGGRLFHTIVKGIDLASLFCSRA